MSAVIGNEKRRWMGRRVKEIERNDFFVDRKCETDEKVKQRMILVDGVIPRRTWTLRVGFPFPLEERLGVDGVASAGDGSSSPPSEASSSCGACRLKMDCTWVRVRVVLHA